MTEIKSYLYGLYDPRKPCTINDIRYIGKTLLLPEKRLRGHICDSKRENNHKANWIKSLIRNGIRPSIMTLAVVPYSEDAFYESRAIEKLREIGARLTNLTDGGEGTKGLLHTEKWKARKSALMQGNKYLLGHKHSEETKEKVRRSLYGNKRSLGCKQSNETIEKRISKLRGRPLSEECKYKIGIANKGKKRTPEMKAKYAAAKIGNKIWVGRHHSEESKIRIGIASRARSRKHQISIESTASSALVPQSDISM